MEFKCDNSQVLSKIANTYHGENSPYFSVKQVYDSDPFHPTKNPNGIIQMAVAENKLTYELIAEWIKKNPGASVCSPEGADDFKNIAAFQDFHGLPEFRHGVAKIMKKVRGGKVNFDPDRIVMAGGVRGAMEMVMFCLADPGDAFLVPSPWYPGFDRFLKWRTGVQLFPIVCESSNNFQITREALEEAYENAQKANIKVKGLVITNPSNPLGVTVDRATLTTLVTFINDKQIHFLCDEVYAATVFRSPEFVSVSEIIEEVECNRNLIHVLYGLAKDLGLSGFRVGIVYSYNDTVMNLCRKMSTACLVSSQTQYFIASMLSDEEFIDGFLSESAARLGRRHDTFIKGLEKAGIKCLESNGAVYCWMDLRHLLKEPTFEAETSLWKTIVNVYKLNVLPGSTFHCNEPGWFRISFASMDDETLQVALERIQIFAGETLKGHNTVSNMRNGK
ncbi:1-aminocyclopropane-1-carboxylate synthase 2 [Sesamum alatum]|uniref:1-aminocyclopropane-1-carboxylate synthase 2 n=1 Tax=Sesamum alatum TaxID=300844 RepID=A0AAE1Y7L5_9LAMI|nr:1-aminocyclopropane-1-carboxylate synthase 2 [Sesamum alatum]